LACRAFDSTGIYVEHLLEAFNAIVSQWISEAKAKVIAGVPPPAARTLVRHASEVINALMRNKALPVVSPDKPAMVETDRLVKVLSDYQMQSYMAAGDVFRA